MSVHIDQQDTRISIVKYPVTLAMKDSGGPFASLEEQEAFEAAQQVGKE